MRWTLLSVWVQTLRTVAPLSPVAQTYENFRPTSHFFSKKCFDLLNASHLEFSLACFTRRKAASLALLSTYRFSHLVSVLYLAQLPSKNIHLSLLIVFWGFRLSCVFTCDKIPLFCLRISHVKSILFENIIKQQRGDLAPTGNWLESTGVFERACRSFPLFLSNCSIWTCSVWLIHLKFDLRPSLYEM